MMVLNSYAAPLARRDSWLEHIEVVDDYAESPYQRAADVLRQLGLAGETTGFEKSYVSANRWEEIGGLLPRARTVDSTELMDWVRWIKTPQEVAAFEAGARLLDEAYLEVLPTVRAGDTERLVHSRIIESCLRRGANWAHGILNSSRNTVAYGGESGMAFEAGDIGDIIRNDYVAYLNGYPGHQLQSVCVGAPSDEQKRIYEVTRDSYRATIERCRPAARSADIYHFANDSFHEAGFQGNVSLAGHGVGDKVANCIALFSLEQLDSFPVDVHVSRSLARHYRDIPRSPEALRRWGQHRFGRYAGYAEAVRFLDDFTGANGPGGPAEGTLL